MATRETELPGVGTKYVIELATGEQLVLVEHRLGHWEIARVDREDETLHVANLQEGEAAEVGRVLSRAAVPERDARAATLLDEFAMEWVTIGSGSLLAGETLQGAGIRARTGVSVVAVLRPEGSIPSPPPDTELRLGDTLVVIGRPEQVERFVSTYGLQPPPS